MSHTISKVKQYCRTSKVMHSSFQHLVKWSEILKRVQDDQQAAHDVVSTFRNEKWHKLLLLFVASAFCLSSCLPAAVTVATGSTIAIAKDRSIEGAVSDATISTKIKASFIKNGFRDLYTKISVDVIDARVLLTGTVDSQEDALTAVQTAWDQNGVEEVINELKIDKKSNYFDLVQFTKDSIITSQIKSKIFVNRGIKFANYTVVTLNNVVYLFGLARTQEELEKVGDIASTIRGVEKVISHAKIKPVTLENDHVQDEDK